MKDGLLWLSQVSAAALVFHSKKMPIGAMHTNAAFSGGIVIGSTLFKRKSSLPQHVSADLSIIHLSISFSFMSKQSGESREEKNGKERNREGENSLVGEVLLNAGLCFQSGDCDRNM